MSALATAPLGGGGVSIRNNQSVTINGVTWTANNFNVSGATPYSLLQNGANFRFQALNGQNDPDFDGARQIRSMLVGPSYAFFTEVTLETTLAYAANTPYPTPNDFNVLMQLHALNNQPPPFAINIAPNGSGGENIEFEYNYQTPNGPVVFTNLGVIPFSRNTNYDIQIKYTDAHGYALGAIEVVVNGVTEVNSSSIVTGYALAVGESYVSFGYYGGLDSGTPVAQDNVVTDANPTFAIGTTPTIPYSYIDGTLGAPTIAAGAQYPSMLSVYTTRPPWNVAGVDYPVGIPDSSKPLINPVTSPPAHCTISGTTLTVNADNVYLNGYDFSVSGGINIVCAHNNFDVINCNFAGANYKTLTNGVINFSGQYCNIRYCNINGGFTTPGAASAPTALLYFSGNNQQISIQYCYLSGCASTVIMLGNASPLNCQYNFFDNVQIASAKSMAYVKWNSGGAEILRVLWQFNTTRQTLVGIGSGVGTTFVDTNAFNAEFFNLVVQYNTSIAPGGTPGQTMNYIFKGNPSPNKIGSTSLVGFNYADPSGTFGMYQPGTWTSPGNLTITGASVNMVTGATVIPDNAFYVSPVGSDSNPGTLASPFLTLNHASGVTTMAKPLVFLRGNAGPFTQSAAWTMKSNQVWRGYPGDAAPIVNCAVSNNGGTSLSNVTVYGLTINGSATDGNGLLGFFACAGMNILANNLTVSGAQECINYFNAQNSNIQGNTFTAPTTNSTNLCSFTVNDGVMHSDVVIGSNTWIGGGRIALEWQCQNSEIFQNCHVDYNNFNGFGGSGAISWVGSTSASNTGNTCYSNTITPATTTQFCSGVEFQVSGCTLSANAITDCPFAIPLTDMTNSSILGNTITLSTTYTPTAYGAYTSDGSGYTGIGCYIGTNVIVFTSSNSVTGCVAGTTGQCTLSPPPSAPVAPIYEPSAPFVA